MNRKESLLDRVILGCLLAALLPLIAAQTIVYLATRDSVQANAQGALNSIAEQRFLRLEAFFRERELDLVGVSRSPVLAQVAQQIHNLLTRRDALASPAFRALSQNLVDQFRPLLSAGEYADILLVSTNGDVLVATTVRPEMGMNLQTKALVTTSLGRVVQACRESGRVAFSDLQVHLPTGRPSIFAAVPVIRSGHLLGIVVAEMKPDGLLAATREASGLGSSGEMLLVLDQGSQFMMLSPSRDQSPPPFQWQRTAEVPSSRLLRQALQTKSGSGVFEDSRGISCVAWWSKLSRCQTTLIVKTDASEAMAAPERFRRLAGGVTLASVAFAGIGILVAFRRLSRPLRELQVGTQKIAAGHLEHRLSMFRADEIGQIASTVNGLLDQARTATASAENLAREAEQSRRAEAANRPFAAAVRQTTNPVLLLSHSGRVEWVNAAYTQATGFTLADVVGRPASILTPGSGPDAEPRQGIAEALRNKQGIRAELLERSKDGRGCWVEVEMQPLLGEKGRVEKWFVIEIDISERKANEAALQRQLADQAAARAELQGMAQGLSERLRTLERESQAAALQLAEFAGAQPQPTEPTPVAEPEPPDESSVARTPLTEAPTPAAASVEAATTAAAPPESLPEEGQIPDSAAIEPEIPDAALPSEVPAEAAANQLPPDRPGMAFSQGVEVAGGDVGFYLALLRDFLARHAISAASIREAIEANEIPQAAAHAQTLKREASELGLEDLAKASGRLESALRQQDVLFFTSSFEELQSRLAAVYQALPTDAEGR